MIIDKLFTAFINQSSFGILICCVIIFIVLIFIIAALNQWIFYKRLTRELKTLRRKDSEEFISGVLIKIYTDFKSSLGKGTERLNTYAVISKNIPETVFLREEFLNYGTSLVVILGLLGTFIGLTGAIQQVEFGLKELKDVKEFTEQIRGPLSSMGTAFMTSIFGIVASIIMNLLALGSYRAEKQRFYDEIEDYLDNHVYIKYSRNYNELLYIFTNKVESSMKYMTDRVTETFDIGIEKFVNRINGVSVDLTHSSRVLNGVIDKLDITIGTFSKPVQIFKESVDNFKLYYEGFDIKIEQFRDMAKEFVQSFRMAIEALDSNRQKMIEMGDSLSISTENLSNSYSRLIALVEKIELYSNRNDEILAERFKDMSETHRQLMIIFDIFKKELVSVADNVSSSLKESFKEETVKISRDLGNKLEQPITSLSDINYSISENVMRIVKMINSLNKMIEELDREIQSMTFTAKPREGNRSIKNRGDAVANE